MVSLARSLVGLLAASVGAAVAFGYVAVAVNPVVAGLAVALFASLAYGISRGDEISVTFGLTLAVVLTAVMKLVFPESVRSQLPFSDLLASVDLLYFAALVGIVVYAWWTLDIRFLSTRAKKPETVASRLRKRTEKLVDSYVSIGRIVALTAFGIVVIIAQQAASGAGEVGSILAEAPYVVGQIATTVWGYLSLGGELPFVGGLGIDVTAGLFAAVALVILFVSVVGDFDG